MNSASYYYAGEGFGSEGAKSMYKDCLLYTSDAADERSSVDLGGRRIIKKKKKVVCRRCSVSTTRTEQKSMYH